MADTNSVTDTRYTPLQALVATAAAVESPIVAVDAT
jgi:hypothetical protein